jgi:hypothetical protein
MFRLMLRQAKRAPWIAVGAAAAYYADPASGVTRRRRLRRQVEARFGPSDTTGSAATDSTPAVARESDGIERRRSEDTVEPIPGAEPLGDPLP